MRRRNLRFIVDHLRDKACVDCGASDSVLLEFDHVRAKRGDAIQMAYDEYSIASLEDEIASCVIRCANVHRRKTIRETSHFRNHFAKPP